MWRGVEPSIWSDKGEGKDLLRRLALWDGLILVLKKGRSIWGLCAYGEGWRVDVRMNKETMYLKEGRERNGRGEEHLLKKKDRETGSGETKAVRKNEENELEAMSGEMRSLENKKGAGIGTRERRGKWRKQMHEKRGEEKEHEKEPKRQQGGECRTAGGGLGGDSGSV
ncbi:hypothetical protein Tco_1084593 [Tanacetum coccineum]